jgi:hypothetical protein
MQKQLVFIIITIFVCCFFYAHIAFARGIPPVELNMIPTANTLGKGGYSFSTGMFQFKTAQISPSLVGLDMGGFFRESHSVRLDSDIWLVPSVITYGISDRFDLMFGGTYSSGNTDKVVLDYYEIGDETKGRVYPQVVYDGVFGGKYKIQDPVGNIPALAVGGEAQLGYTIDTDFVDKTLEDSLPFIAMHIYLSASYDFVIANVHGGLGMFVSSKNIQASERFGVPAQVGAEFPFDGFAAVVDITLFKAFSGIDLGTVISGGLRYDISSRTTINVSVASSGGFIARLTIGGKRSTIPVKQQSAPTLF